MTKQEFKEKIEKYFGCSFEYEEDKYLTTYSPNGKVLFKIIVNRVKEDYGFGGVFEFSYWDDLLKL